MSSSLPDEVRESVDFITGRYPELAPYVYSLTAHIHAQATALDTLTGERDEHWANAAQLQELAQKAEATLARVMEWAAKNQCKTCKHSANACGNCMTGEEWEAAWEVGK